MHAVIHAADVQDRDGGVLVMATLFGPYPFLLKLYADGGYQGPQLKVALQRVTRQVNLEIVKRSDAAKAFIVLPKRWIVERTIGWLNRCRRLAKDWEGLNRNASAFLSCSESSVAKHYDLGRTLKRGVWLAWRGGWRGAWAETRPLCCKKCRVEPRNGPMRPKKITSHLNSVLIQGCSQSALSPYAFLDARM